MEREYKMENQKQFFSLLLNGRLSFCKSLVIKVISFWQSKKGRFNGWTCTNLTTALSSSTGSLLNVIIRKMKETCVEWGNNWLWERVNQYRRKQSAAQGSRVTKWGHNYWGSHTSFHRQFQPSICLPFFFFLVKISSFDF